MGTSSGTPVGTFLGRTAPVTGRHPRRLGRHGEAGPSASQSGVSPGGPVAARREQPGSFVWSIAHALDAKTQGALDVQVWQKTGLRCHDKERVRRRRALADPEGLGRP